MDRHSVGVFLGANSQAFQFGNHGGDAIRFLVSHVSDIADRGRTAGEHRDGGQGLCGVADRVHVDVNAAQRTAMNRRAVIRDVNFTAHRGQRVDEV